MKISGFAQLRNELSNGNLHNWFKCMNSICDNIFIYDQASDDGSLEEYKNHNTHVIESSTNDFSKELICKSKLLKCLLEKSPDTDWILWLDGDEILERKVTKEYIHQICSSSKEDMIAFGFYNLWRSDNYYRIDSNYHWLNDNGPGRLWRNNGQLNFAETEGLHQVQVPMGSNGSKRIDCSIIHRGFATDESIVRKYLNYRSRGQAGESLDRLIDETTLKVKSIPYNSLPEWFDITDTVNPTTKEKIVDKYKDQLK